jgi:glycosyltransferase involved in cell wall biosynthesis
VRIFYQELRAVAETLRRTYECVFVNDGSVDQTAAILDDIAQKDPRVRVIHLARNQGEAAALSAGFQHARGRTVVTLDGDGQNDPHDIPALLAKMDEGYPVVSGWRRKRQEDYWKRILPSRLANSLIAWATGVPIHDCGCGLKAYRREILSGVSLPEGMHRFLPTILRVPPEAVAEVPVNDRMRVTGSSHYGLGRIFAVLRDLLPAHCIRREPRIVTRILLGSLAITTLVLWGVLNGGQLSSRPGSLALLAVDVISLVYLTLTYRRFREFLKAQEQQAEHFSDESV